LIPSPPVTDESLLVRPTSLLLVSALGLSIFGCGPAKAPSSSPPAQTEARVVDVGPTKVELGPAKAAWREPEAEVVKFEIPYQFTSGSPLKVYQCRVTFPDQGAAGVKPMEAWELKQEGVIRTGIPANGQLVKAYKIEFWEAEAPDKAFYLVSNTVTGEVPPPPPAAPRTPETSPQGSEPGPPVK